MQHAPAIPDDFKQYRQFVTWRLAQREGDPKPTKIPNGSTTDPTTWKSYDEAVLEMACDDTITGIGFVFTDDDPFVFFDADGCLQADNSWHPDAMNFIANIHGASWETSQSGQGLHAVARADKEALKRKRNKFTTAGGVRCEFYMTARFMAIGAGNWTLPVPLDATKYFLELIPDRPETVDTTDDLIDRARPGYTGPQSDDELISRACAAKGSAAQAFGAAATFEDLWTKNEAKLAEIFPDESGTGFDHSSADAALMERLAFWTGYHETRMIRLFGRSALAQRDKWQKRPDYQARTVKSVTTRANARYIGSDKTDTGAVTKTQSQQADTTERTTWTPPVTHDMTKTNGDYIARVIYELGNALTFDEFASRIMLNGRPIEDADYTNIFVESRRAAAESFTQQLVDTMINYTAFQNRYHPVRDYLESVASSWDGTPRLDTWLIDHASALDTPYTRAVASKALIGAVRRIYEPGAKHDEMIVLEGPQNSGKSSLVRALCPDPSWFTDAVTLNMESKELIEVTQGRWFVEAPELSRLTGSEAEHVKALLSRAEDVARLSYGRTTSTRPRQFIIVGTTNEDQYLQDLTGNRRFLPIRTGTIDLDGLAAARDQIFAEAVTRYRAGETNELPREVLAEARVEQERRTFENEYIEQLEDLIGDKTGSVSARALFELLEVPSQRRRYARRHVNTAMESLGWTKTERGFVKGNPARKWNALGAALVEAAPELKVMPK